MGHKPRFYTQRGPRDNNYGHKRRCEDFTELKYKFELKQGGEA